MEEDRANRVVARLRERGVFAHLERSGVYQFGVRVVIPDGREAVWDSDDTKSIEAQVMQDGVLVGYVPRVPGSADLGEDGLVDLIAGTDYDAPPGSPAAPSDRPPVADRPAGPTGSPPPGQLAAAPQSQHQPGRLARLFRRGA